MTEATGIGALLRRTREAQGLSVDDVAQQLKFAPRQIESLEEERFDRLPGPTIARGMVRNYARLLRIEPEPLLERMAPSAGAQPGSGSPLGLKQPVPLTDSGRRSTLVYTVFSVAVLALVAVVAYYSWHQGGPATQFVSPAAPTQPAPGQPASEQPASEQPAAAQPLPAPPPQSTPTQAAATAPPPTASEPPALPVQEKLVEKPQPAVEKEKPLPAGMLRIVLRCEEEAWLEVKDGAGRTLVSSLTPAGSERIVRGRAPLEIVVGNPGFVTLLVNDKPMDLKPHVRAGVARLTIK